MRHTLLLALLLLTSCPHTDGITYAVQLTDACRDPQTTYTQNNVGSMDGFNGAHFVMADSPEASSATATATIDCGATTSGAPAELNLNTDRVTIDPTMVSGELAWIAVMSHEIGGHWQIHHGAHPERARVHPCPTADYLGDPALCNTDHWLDTMVMAPSTPGIGMGNGGWNGDIEDMSGIPHSQITLEDQEFLAWALTR
jgi:hypothetical protein